MASNFELCLNMLMGMGGDARHTITLDQYQRWCFLHGHPDPDADALANMPKEHIVAIYRDFFWDSLRCSRFPLGVALTLFDAAAHHGALVATTWLHETLGALGHDVGGEAYIGTQTIKAIDRSNRALLIEEFMACRLRALMHMCQQGRIKLSEIKGVSRHVVGVYRAALDISRNIRR